MEVQLKVMVGSAKGQTIKVIGPKFFIGRSEDCQLRPKSDLISRHHCALILEGDYLAIRDFGSKNGTYVNQQRVAGERELQPGDQLTVGPLEFELLVEKVSISAAKRPKVHNISEAAARQAESARSTNDDSTKEMDIDDWLTDEGSGDTREMMGPETSRYKLDETISEAPPAPSEAERASTTRIDSQRTPGKLPKPTPDSASSDDAASEVLRKLRRFR